MHPMNYALIASTELPELRTGADHQDFGAIATAPALKRFRFGDGGMGDRGENNKTSMNFGFWIWF